MSRTVNFQNFSKNTDFAKTKLISNFRTYQPWNLRASVAGEYFSGPESLYVEPLLSKTYEVTYYPTRMTVDGQKHNVSINYSF